MSYLPDVYSQSTTNEQIWIDFYPHYYHSEKLEYYGDFGYRTIISEDKWRRLYARPSLRKHVSDLFEWHLGLGVFYIFNEGLGNRLEITPWQGVKLKWPSFGNLKFNHLIRIEERISYLTRDWESSFDPRLRYKLGVKYNLCNTCEAPYWFIEAHGEGFYPIENDIDEIFRNRYRTTIGIGRKISDLWTYSFHFNFQNSRSGPNEELEVSDYAYQLKIKKTIDKRKD